MQKNLLITIITTIMTIALCINPLFAERESSSIAILKSNTSATEYSKQDLGSYEDAFKDIISTFNVTNVRYEIVNENEISSGAIQYKYKIIIIPMGLNISDRALTSIEEFTNSGGQIIVSDPGGDYTDSAKELTDIVGVSINSITHLNDTAQVDWLTGKTKPSENSFPPSSRISVVSNYSGAKPIAIWRGPETEDIPAVTKSSKGCFISWPWGTEGDISFNSFVIKGAINSLIPGLTSQETVQITNESYNKYKEEITNLQNSADGAMSTVIQADLTVPLTRIQEQLYRSKVHKALFESYYNERQFAKAQDEYSNSKKTVIDAYARTIPSRLVEGRAIWLDRGTIVSVKEPQEMKKLFDKIEETGINIVYFETINAGYPIYPSSYIEQNPLTKGYDPLKTAIDEAHKRNIELHAWTWIFAVGNTRHNGLINKPQSYPGPIISNDFYDGALIGNNGNLLPRNQPEYWLDPANPEVQELMLKVLKEIVTNYNVDGLQLDYIRYPFQGGGNWMGYDFVGRELFEKDTGYNLDNLNSETQDAWKYWKANKISEFVETASSNLKSIKPELQISAAVYAMDKRRRMETIQQDWELWAERGWIDTLSPMSYATNSEKLTELAGYVNESTSNKALVYPGLAIRQLDTAGFLEQLDTVRSLGMVGNTIFAMAHLNSDKLNILENGPYRNKSLVIPNRDPLKASSLLLEDFLVRVHRFINNGKIFTITKNDEIRVKNASQELYTLIQEASTNPSTAKIDNAYNKSLELSKLVKEWLMFESNLRPGRVRLLTDYLNQIASILAYARHKQATKFQISQKKYPSETY